MKMKSELLARRFHTMKQRSHPPGEAEHITLAWEQLRTQREHVLRLEAMNQKSHKILTGLLEELVLHRLGGLTLDVPTKADIRDAALEEAAKACDAEAAGYRSQDNIDTAICCALAVRQLKAKP